MIRRLGFLGAFVLILAPFVVIILVSLLAAGLTWIAVGGDQEGVLLNPLVVGLAEWPFSVLEGGESTGNHEHR